MKKSSPSARHKQLTRLLNNFDRAYYDLNHPMVDDAEYDAVRRELLALEKQHPELVKSDSPSQQVGYQPSGRFRMVDHRLPMLSLGNAFSVEEVLKWLNQLPPRAGIVVEKKLDGLAVNLLYRDQQFATGSTRGDGYVGEDVTLNLQGVNGVIQKLPASLADKIVEVRGEVVVHRVDFEMINQSLIEHGKKPFIDPRNYAAGSLRQKSPTVTAGRRLQFYAYQVIVNDESISQKQALILLEECGFKTALLKCYTSTEVAIKDCAELLKTQEKTRMEEVYDIDGIVFKVEQASAQQALGERAREPRWALAYKFPPKTGISRTYDVDWRVGRTGVLTPVACIEPVQVGGVTVTHVNLHNWAEIQRLDLHKEDRVTVSRVGDVIPKITFVTKSERPRNAVPITPPSHCPVCSSVTTITASDVHCSNPDCAARNLQRFLHACGRQALDLPGVGERILEALVANGSLKGIQDLLKLRIRDFEDILGPNSILAEKLAETVISARRRPMHRIIFALGIPGVGLETARQLETHYRTVAEFRMATLESLKTVDDIGPITADAILTFLAEKAAMLDEYFAAFEEITPSGSSVEKILAGRRVVLTGSRFNGRTRSEMEVYYRDLGAVITKEVTPKTHVVVVGTSPTVRKVEQAKRLNITLIDLNPKGPH